MYRRLESKRLRSGKRDTATYLLFFSEKHRKYSFLVNCSCALLSLQTFLTFKMQPAAHLRQVATFFVYKTVKNPVFRSVILNIRLKNQNHFFSDKIFIIFYFSVKFAFHSTT